MVHQPDIGARAGLLAAALAAEPFCYLETTGRVTGRPHTVEMWFAAGEDGATIYCLAGGGDRSDWVRNIRASPALRVRIGGVTFPATGRIALGGPDELAARRALAAKYYGWRDGPLPNEWARMALPVAIRLDQPAGAAKTADRPVADPTPDDLRVAAAICRAALEPALDRDWSAKAGDLDWSCRRTLDHVVDSLVLYAAFLATRARGRLALPRDGDPRRSVAELLAAVEAAAAILAEVARAAPPEARAFHPAGLGDPAGFLAMACEEILVHTDDVARGLGLSFRPADEGLVRRVVRRIFPWAPHDADPWDALRWGAGRIALPDRPRLGPDWWFHPAPLSEWDGTIKRRTAETPPAWS